LLLSRGRRCPGEGTGDAPLLCSDFKRLDQRVDGRDKARALLSQAGVLPEKVIEHVDNKNHIVVWLKEMETFRRASA